MAVTPTPLNSRSLSPRQKLIREVRLSMGEGMITLGLKPEHFEAAFDFALDRYRVRSPNAVEERIGVLDMIDEQNEYYLPEEVMVVRQIFRRGVTGSSSGSGSSFDPFGAAFATQFAFAGFGSTGDLVTYELFGEYQALLGRLFGAALDFIWTPTSHRLNIQRNIRGPETVLIWMYMYRPEELLLQDVYARNWLRDYTIAKCKLFLGEAREKFASLPGPQGGMTLNGAALKTEAAAEFDRLEKEVSMQVDQSDGYPFIFG